MKKIWILVQVKRGFIIEPEIFYVEKEAVKRKAELMKRFNRDYDEIEIFEKLIP
ncbi:MAG: hypothetical protein KJ607_01745 [Bacteroidetes bacterium]|nr:hypothetical protein [Bacteroidota bacterium]